MKDWRLPADTCFIHRSAGVYRGAAIDQQLGCVDGAVLRGYVQERRAL